MTGTPGGPITLSATLNVGSPIQPAPTFAPGAVILSSQPLTVKWAGGDPGTLVRVALFSGGVSIYSYASATAGSLTMQPRCAGTVCSFGLPPTINAGITISVVPAQPTAVSLPGITGGVQLSWSYLYEFSGLTLTN